MSSLRDVEKEVLAIYTEWKRAEFCIKQSEQLNGAAVWPAIKELRYAGRRLIDGLHYALVEDDLEKSKEYLLDARFDCNRARHDAVDATVSKIAISASAISGDMPAAFILAHFPHFKSFIKDLETIQNKIAKSRGGDASLRERIYEEVEDEELARVISGFKMIDESREKYLNSDLRAKRVTRIFHFVGIVGTLCLLVMAIRWALSVL